MMSEHQPSSYSYFATKQLKSKHKSPARVYPHGVSPFLTGFLNGDHANDVDSGSESDDSFFSYSARLDMLQSTRNLELSSIRPLEHDLSPMSTIPPSLQFTQQPPPSRPMKKLTQRKQTEVRRERKMSHPTQKFIKANNARIKIRNPSVSKQSFLPKPEVQIVPLRGSETDLPYESVSKGQQAKPEMCDAEVQTTPVVFAQEEQKCPFCHAITFSPNLPTLSSGQFSPVRDNQAGKHTNFDSPTNKSEGQLSIPIKLKAVGPGSSSSSQKTSSFSSSDAMPEDLEHYVRASFLIPKAESQEPKSSIDDPDGLRQGLSALLSGSPIKKNPLSIEIPKPIERSDERPMSPLSSSSSPANLASISGVLFADPFLAGPSRNVSTPISSPPKPCPLSRPRAQHGRSSSLRQSLDQAPPVPIIPDVFAHAQNRRLSGILGPSSPTPPSVYSSRQSSPRPRPEPQLCYMGNVPARQSSTSHPEHLRHGSYKGKEVSYDVEVAHQYGSYDSDDHFLPSHVTEIIHPHSPVHVAKPFPRRLSTRPELDETEDETERARRLHRNPSAVIANLDPEIQKYFDSKLKMPTRGGSIRQSRSSQRSLGSGSTNRSSEIRIHGGSIRGSASTSLSSEISLHKEMPIHKGDISQPRPERRSFVTGSIHRPSITRNSTGSSSPPKEEGRNSGRYSPPKVEQRIVPEAQQRRRSSLWKKFISGPLPAGPDAKMPGSKSGPRKLVRRQSRNRK